MRLYAVISISLFVGMFGCHSAAAETFTHRKMALSLKKDKKPAPAPAAPQSDTGKWRIDREAPLPDYRVSENSPELTRRCIYYEQQKLICRDSGFDQIFTATNGKTAIVTSSGEHIRGEIIALDNSGRVIGQWQASDYDLFWGKASKMGDLFVAVYESSGSTHVVGISLAGEFRWHHEFSGARNRMVMPDYIQLTKNGKYVIASNGVVTRILDWKGELRGSFDRLRPHRLIHNDERIVLCSTKQVLVLDLATRKTLANLPDVPGSKPIFVCHGASDDGEQVIVSEELNSSPKSVRDHGIGKVHVLDLKRKTTSTATHKMPPSVLSFDTDGDIRAERDGRAESFGINE